MNHALSLRMTIFSSAVQSEPVRAFGVPLVGVTPGSGRKLLLSLALFAVIVAVRLVLGRIARSHAGERASGARTRFWFEQVVSLLALSALVIGLASIWFETQAQLTGVMGLLAAGVAIALQRVITAFAAYLIILRGNVFTVGDRIVMGGVRGDVVALGFMQTTIMEMGEPPPEQADAPAQWVHARQYSGRIVRVTNDRIFDSAVYNYTREFPYLWEEFRVGISFTADSARAERILLDAAERHTARIQEASGAALAELQRRYPLKDPVDVKPRVYWRLTDNWLELALRFVTEETGVRGLKDAMSRDILAGFNKAGIGIASTTFEVVGLPPVRLVDERAANHSRSAHAASGTGTPDSTSAS